ncbi:hypothetical protein R3P38DRAFT_3004245 [Favolaschia claudopus]|uniref:Uncharacterized protein n=1 Tax=Favolaschia claudopus TaxID=2862362 RepID=A0AAW0ALF7_9AGAR
MVHGFFHAALPLTAYGSRASRVPRILEFALRDDVKGAVLERRAGAHSRGSASRQRYRAGRQGAANDVTESIRRPSMVKCTGWECRGTTTKRITHRRRKYLADTVDSY